MTAAWEHFAHGADVGIRGRGSSLAEALAAAATAMTAVVTDPATVRPETPVDIHCAAPSAELLLVDWLNALVLEMAARSMLFSRFDLHCGDGRLDARAWGEKVDVGRHEPAVEVKGATLTELAVRRGQDGEWTAQCVVDV
jgi:tRNA nucleotidyltransferase (CCA-adding enzyme)